MTKEVAKRRHPLTVRDKDGLMLDQKRLLAELLENTDWKVACAEAEVPVHTLRRWLRDDEAFLKAYEKLFSTVLTESKAKLTSLMPRVGDVFEDGLDAQKPIESEVRCPECGTTFTAIIEVPAWGVKLRVAEDLLKSHGQFAQRHVVEGEVTHRNTTLEDLIGVAIDSRGGRLPPGVREDLAARGLLPERQAPEPPPDPDAVEAEYTAVNSEDE